MVSSEKEFDYNLSDNKMKQTTKRRVLYDMEACILMKILRLETSALLDLKKCFIVTNQLARKKVSAK